MVQIIMFDKTDDILQLTGLKTRAGLWDAGFNLDDWDAGFCSDIRLHEFQLLRIQWEALLHGSSFLKAACQLADERKRIHDYPDRDENRHSGLLF